METEGFKYFAFISYSHKDQKTAKRLHRRLQSYHLPSDMQKSNPNLPKRLNPVFMDESNLVGTGTLKESLRKNLDASNYLIVICSPNSAKSEYVNDEVQYFIDNDRTNHIIPLIIDGIPHAEDESLECFPRAILNLPREDELLGINLKRFGERDAFSRVIATLLRLDLDNFVDYEKRRRRRKIAMIVSLSAAFIIAAGIYIWRNIIPHYSYYRSYVYKWEKPVGLFEVKNESERQKMEYTYKFTETGGKLRKIERINSAGILVDPSIITPFTELPMIRFVSDRTVEYYDVNGKKIFRKEYTKNFEAVDFYRGDEDFPYSVQPYMLDSYEINKFGDSELADKEAIGNIIRHSLEYDDNGYVKRKMFRLNNYGGYDQKGILVKDESGRSGMSYTVDDMGRVIGIQYLNENRAPMNVSGVYAEHIEYGDTAYPVKVTYSDKNGNPTGNFQNIANIDIAYDENLNVKKLSYYDAEGKRVLDKKYIVSGKVVFIVSEVVFTHDTENGFLTSEHFCGTDLIPSAKGEASVDFERDKEGRITQCLIHDAKGGSIVYVGKGILDDYLSGKIPIDAEGAYNLGKMISEGKSNYGTDLKRAFQFFRMAAEQGHAEAQSYLGFMYTYGLGVENDYKQAATWYTKSAEQGNAGAQFLLGNMCASGQGVEQDYKQAFFWFTKSAEQGNAGAQLLLGKMYASGQGVEHDDKQAFFWFTKSAEHWNANAQLNLGNMYSNGQGVEQDYKQAVLWYTKSAELGNAEAQYSLGYMYEKGLGVEKDYKQAATWYRKSAEQGNAKAQCNLGRMYRDGQGVEQDYEQAATWIRKAAERGNSDAQLFLGNMYIDGEGVEHDYEQAVFWYTKSAEQGDYIAQYILGEISHDNEQRVFWYTKSAEHGNILAQWALGNMYENGEIVEKNLQTAYMWYYLAYLSGDEPVEKSMKNLNGLTESQINEAKAQAEKKFNEIKEKSK